MLLHASPPHPALDSRPVGDVLLNPDAQARIDGPHESLEPVRRFHARLPGYEPTPLRDVPALARELGVARVLVKDESRRLGLPAFKILGASWALYKRIEQELDLSLGDWSTFDQLRTIVNEQLPGVELVTATDGNHGRAVAHLARIFRLPARIYMPGVTVSSRIRAVESEDARAVLIEGTYDDAVAAARADADRSGAWLIQDNSWDGYEEIPRWVAQGYATMMLELDEQLEAQLEAQPDAPLSHVFVPVGVGTFAARVVTHLRSRANAASPTIISVEPTRAPCALESVRAGRAISLAQDDHSIMAGLDCPTPASLAFPVLARGVDAFIAIEDEVAEGAMRRLASVGIESGESGAAALGGLIDLLQNHASEARTLGIDSTATVLAFSTEGATNRAAWERITRESVTPRT